MEYFPGSRNNGDFLHHFGSKGIIWGWKIDHLDLGDLGGGLCSIIMLVSKDMANTYTNRKTMCLHVIERYRCSNCLPNKIIHIDPFSVQEIGLRCQFQTRPRHDCWSHSAGTCQSEDCSMSPPTLRAT